MQRQRISEGPSGGGVTEAMNRLVDLVLTMIMTDALAQ